MMLRCIYIRVNAIRLRAWGYAKVSKAIALLEDLQPLLRPFASHLERLVYDPIQLDEPLILESKRLTGGQPFLESIQQAAVARTPSRCLTIEQHDIAG
jgi:hypothetical protein